MITNDMRDIVWRRIRIVLFVCGFMCLFVYVSLVLEDNSCRWMKGKYYAGTSKCDIITLGTSHTLDGIYPQVMGEAGVHGVYNMGGYAQRIPTSYWILKNAVDYGRPKPKIVLLDLHTILSDDKYPPENLEFLHSSVDSMPFTPDKYAMINDLIPEHKTEFVFDFYKYHNRWNELELGDLEVLRYFLADYHGFQNGAVYNDEIKDEGKPDIISMNIYEEPLSVGREYLDKIIDLCDREGILLIVVNLPYNEDEDNQKAVNWVRLYANEKGFMFYDMLRDNKLQIDYATDFCGAGHLNTAGAPKVSKALAEYMLNDCTDWLE